MLRMLIGVFDVIKLLYFPTSWLWSDCLFGAGVTVPAEEAAPGKTQCNRRNRSSLQHDLNKCHTGVKSPSERSVLFDYFGCERAS